MSSPHCQAQAILYNTSAQLLSICFSCSFAGHQPTTSHRPLFTSLPLTHRSLSWSAADFGLH